jgi:DNA-binding NtrC family response regulator
VNAPLEVLLVDDDPHLRRFVGKLIERTGNHATEAASVEIAESLLASRRFDVILSDVVMPERRGVELGDAVARLQPNAGLVYMSGYASAVLGEHPAALDDAILLQKPFEAEALQECIELAYIRGRSRAARLA